jgi:hypothetical protein
MKTRICEICGNEYKIYVRLSCPEEKIRKTCSKECHLKRQSRIFSGSNNPAFGKTYRSKETHPEWVAKISNTHKERGTLVGDKNPMKNPEVAARASVSRIKLLSVPETRKRLCSDQMKNSWIAGKFDGVAVGKCEWHDYTMRDGSVIKCQGTWELKYAKYLDDSNVEFEAHVGRIPYIDDSGAAHSYYPDFVLADGTLIDVKNPLYEVKHARKLQLVEEQNKVKIVVINKQKMEELGLLT